MATAVSSIWTARSAKLFSSSKRDGRTGEQYVVKVERPGEELVLVDRQTDGQTNGLYNIVYTVVIM